MPGKPIFPTLTTVLLLIVLFGVSAAVYPGLASPQVVANLLIDNAFLLVLAVGMGFVIISGGIDLSVGAVLALTTTACAWLLQWGIAGTGRAVCRSCARYTARPWGR